MDDHAYDLTVVVRNEHNANGETRYSANSLTTYVGDYTGKHGPAMNPTNPVPLLSFRCSGHLVVVPLSEVVRIETPRVG